MKKIVDYKLVTNQSINGLYKIEGLVLDALQEGRQPLGGICYQPEVNTMIQAMVKYEV